MTEPVPRASRRLQAHRPPRGMGPAFLLSILAHVVLILAIAFAVRWNTQPVGPVAVELWGGSPPPVTVTPPPPAPAPPPPKIEPAPERPADIVLEPKKAPPKVEPKKVEPKEEQKKEAPKKPPPPDPKIEAKRLADAKAAEAKKVAEKVAEAKRAAERHDAELKRITAAAAGPARSSASAGMPSGYDAQVISCIRPHIVFAVPDGVRPGQYVAEFEVSLAPTGEQLGAPKLLKPSGLPAYDQAVERAIRRCDPFPRPKEGAVPRVLRPVFDPIESR